MKLTKTVRKLYEENKEQALLLKKYADNLFEPICQENQWIYETRIKSEESFALKLESGRNATEDFFACRIIVMNKTEIDKVYAELKKLNIEKIEQRPTDLKRTKLSPEQFSFNDIRLYLRLKQLSNNIPKKFLDYVFELQITPFFSYAWMKTTHDLIYKNQNISWAKNRIAYQIKAILEQAQYSIDTIETLADDYFPTQDNIENQNKIIEFLKDKWKERLPIDLIRLSNNIMSFLKTINSNVDECFDIINKESSDNRGAKLLNITPYQAIIQSYANLKPQYFERIKNNNKFKIVITDELNLSNKLIKELTNSNKVKDYRNTSE